MRCAPNSREKQGGTKAGRIAALRKVVDGLQSIPDGTAPEHLAAGVDASLAPGLPGPGFISGVLNEAIAAHDQSAAFGFVFALAAAVLRERAGLAVFVATQRALRCGAIHGHGLNRLGVDVGRLLLVDTETGKDALWALEEALRSRAKPAIVIGAVETDLDLTQSRRLNLAAAVHATPLLLVCSPHAAGANAAATRWRIAPAPAALDRFGTVVYSRWHVTLERCRNGRTGAWLIEWDHVARRFRLVEDRAGSSADSDFFDPLRLAAC